MLVNYNVTIPSQSSPNLSFDRTGIEKGRVVEGGGGGCVSGWCKEERIG